MRIGNLEYRKCTYLCEPPEHIRWEICKWEPNKYYGHESEYIKDGEWYHPNVENYKYIRIHRDCFKSPETSYQIASWKWNDHEDCYDFEFCGDRPLNLTDEEWMDFKALINVGFRRLNPYWYDE